MNFDTENWIKNCNRCLRRKSTCQKAPLINITSSYALKLVCLDYLTLEPCKGGINNILVITEHYTRFAMTVPTKNQTAKTTAESLYNSFIIHQGFPARLHSDQGAQFESNIIKELCEITKMEKSRTSPYHPMSNGMTKRFSRTLLNMLGTLENNEKQNWKKYIPSLVHAYNCTRHESTGYSPFELMFGRKPRLPAEAAFGLENSEENKKNYNEYILDLKNRMEKTFDIVQKAAEKSRTKHKVQFDKKANANKLHVGDHVLLRILAYDGKHKIADKFEENVYVIKSQPNQDTPVFVILDKDGHQKTVHRN